MTGEHNLRRRMLIMMNRMTTTMIFLATAAFVLATVPAAYAHPCGREAKRDAQDCGAACKETFQLTKDTCLNRDHACVEQCRANRSQCRLDTGFDANIDSCNDALEVDRKKCRVDNPTLGPDRDACIDLAQVKAFQCRDTARERAKLALEQCRKGFRDCASACGGTAPVDPGTCIGAAKDAAKTCAQTCREAYQAAKDDCRGLDHNCVELCRSARTDCRQPIRDTLKIALEACDAPRKIGVDGCKALYPKPRDFAAQVAFDLCVDPFQLTAFICRDGAHEAARPGLEGCRDLFQACVKPACVLPTPAP